MKVQARSLLFFFLMLERYDLHLDASDTGAFTEKFIFVWSLLHFIYIETT